jgi:hypothetical protein
VFMRLRLADREESRSTAKILQRYKSPSSGVREVVVCACAVDGSSVDYVCCVSSVVGI